MTLQQAVAVQHAIQKRNAEMELQRLELVEEIRQQNQTLLQQQQHAAQLAAQEMRREALRKKIQESSQILDFFDDLQQRGSQPQ